ncbi:MAG: NAD(P)/FAD-dependent oxidoreductase [Lachnospiraceae bacterium]|nr:NAD(P)/FAD-dependent oxidoreductase [Lachnospiraceae bacterium]
MENIVVIGGGAAGMMTAATAAGAGRRVCLLEKNEKLGKKLFITGKGRCNLTNACETEELLSHVVTNRRFLYSSFYGFSNYDTIEFFERLGMKTKIERGNRVFPESDHAYDVIDALSRELRRKNVSVRLRTEAAEILTEPLPDAAADDASPEGGGRGKKKSAKTQTSRAVGVRLKNGGVLSADAVVVATGGLSYPSTGSTGDGYRFAGETGHEVTECVPSLVSLTMREAWCGELSGLSLKNVSVRFEDAGGKQLYEGFGEMLFTHRGVSGPIILTATAECSEALRGAVMYLDLKPALSAEQLEQRLLRECEAAKGKQLRGLLGALMPASLAGVLCRQAPADAGKAVSQLTREERAALAAYLKRIPLHVAGLGGFSEAVVTKGGVAVSQISPATMESRLVKGLYFVGEVLDLDALTGGFNLQIAWSTAVACGRDLLKSKTMEGK